LSSKIRRKLAEKMYEGKKRKREGAAIKETPRINGVQQ
jgi:hypothetical protein